MSSSLLLNLKSFYKNNLFPYFKIFLGIILGSLTYTLIPLWFLKYIPNEFTLGISSQYQLISLFIGVFQETFSLITISILGKKYFKNYIILSFALILFLGVLGTSILFILAKPLCLFWNIPNEIINTTVSFFRVCSFSIPFLFLNSFLLVIISNLNATFYLKVKILNFLLAFLINYFLFYPSFFSLSLGIEGLGYNYLLQSIFTFLFLFYFFKRTSFKLEKNIFPRIGKKKLHLFLGFFISSSFFIILSSSIRNFSYSYLFLSPLNSLGVNYSSSWFINSSLFWSIYLIPSLALSQWQQIKILNYKREALGRDLIIKTYKKILIMNFILFFINFIFYKISYSFILKNVIYVSDINTFLLYKKMGNYFFFTYSFYSFSFILRVYYYVEGKINIISYITIICSLFLLFINLVFNIPSFTYIKVLFCIDLVLETSILFIYFIFKIKN